MIAFSRLSIAVALLSLVFLFPLSTATAAELEVDSTRALANAIENASDGDVLVLTRDIQLQRYLPRITADIAIEGGGHKIDGMRRRSIFFIDEAVTVRINNLTMTNGFADNCLRREQRRKRDVPECPDPKKWTWGGAIYNDGGNLSISNSNFRQNATEGYGGAIFSRKGKLHITNSHFIGNSSDGNGGALSNQLSGLTVSGSLFLRNATDGYGGAISSSADVPQIITDSSFSHNWAASSGGAIETDGDALTISDSSFTANVAKMGGGISNIGELNISDSSFRYNSADWGGAIWNYFSQVAIRNSVFEVNTAGNGGAIEDDAGHITITGSRFIDNSAETRGGAIRSQGGSLSVVDSGFTGNKAVDEGGALYIGSDLRLAQVTIADNAAEAGGGVYLAPFTQDISIVFRNSVIARNDGGDCVRENKEFSNDKVVNLFDNSSCDPGPGGNSGTAATSAPWNSLASGL